MADFPDYYAVLGVRPDASPEEIEQAYATLLHSARVGVIANDSDPPAAAPLDMKRVQEAYDLLRHAGKRADYDAWHTTWRTSGATGRQRDGRQVSQPVRHPCPRCEGSGRSRCFVCEGRGDPMCAGCAGQGTAPCVLCLGVGTLSEAFSQEVHEVLSQRVPREGESTTGVLSRAAAPTFPESARRVAIQEAAKLMAGAALAVLAVFAALNMPPQPARRLNEPQVPTVVLPGPAATLPAPAATAPAPSVSLPTPPASKSPPGSGVPPYQPSSKALSRTPGPSIGSTSAGESRLSGTRRGRAEGPRTIRGRVPGAAVTPKAAPAPTPGPSPVTASGPLPVTPSTVPLTLSAREAIEDVVLEVISDWAQALMDGDLGSHMAHYANLLERYFTKTHVAWDIVYREKRRFLFSYPTMVDYRIRNVQITAVAADVALAVFDKYWDYRTGDDRRFAGDERQRLKLRNQGGRWKIVSEEEIQVYWVVRD